MRATVSRKVELGDAMKALHNAGVVEEELSEALKKAWGPLLYISQDEWALLQQEKGIQRHERRNGERWLNYVRDLRYGFLYH